MANALRGFFRPKNPQKYRGNVEKIVFRSSWELRLMKFLDENEDILQWQSEEVIVNYRCPFKKGKVRRYFPDFVITRRKKDGIVETVMVEVKPKAQTVKPKVQVRKTKQYVRQVVNWAINQNKWDAADKYCKTKGWEFKILTEDHLEVPW